MIQNPNEHIDDNQDFTPPFQHNLNSQSAPSTRENTFHPEIQGQANPQKMTNNSSATLRHPGWIVLVVLALAIFTDLIIYKQSVGLQWALFVNLLLLVTVGLASMEHRRVPLKSYWLAVPISLAAVLTVFRLEDYTLVALVLFTLIALLLLAASLLSGQWAVYRIREYFTQGLRLLGSILIGLPATVIQAFRKNGSSDQGTDSMLQSTRKENKAAAVLRGLLIALPLLLIFGALLASADTIFSEKVGKLFSWIYIENMGDLVAQAALVLVITYLLFGALKHALTLSAEKQPVEPDSALLKPFLGSTESSIILVSLNLLFAAFLVVQFRYFFAGVANVSLEGFTYAEYARRGFFELLAVACISLVLQYALAGITRREQKRQRVWFSVLSAVLLLQVGMILISAFQRLSLYEAAYGFTQDRLVSHVFMVFVGLLLVVSILMELTNRFKHMALVLLLSFLAFGLTLAFINVDVAVADRNLDRAMEGKDLDSAYLVWGLSEDATPTLFARFDDPATPAALQEELGQVLSCRAAKFAEENDGAQSWVSWHASRSQAEKLYQEYAQVLAAYPLQTFEYGMGVVLEGEEITCSFQGGGD